MSDEAVAAPSLPAPLQAMLEKLAEVEARWRSEPSPEIRAEHYATDLAACFAGMEMQSRTIERVGKQNEELRAHIRMMQSEFELMKTLAKNDAIGAARTEKIAGRKARRGNLRAV
jgi:predicted RNase H-like nuclease (RuvC/YqgF family)